MVEPKGTGGQTSQAEHAASDLLHEPVGTDVTGIIRWMIVFALLVAFALVLCFTVMTELSQRLGRGGESSDEPARPRAVRAASPGLEFNSTEPLRKLRAREEQLLHQAGWVDREEGIARIPIEKAMEMVASRAGRQDDADRQNGAEPQDAANGQAPSNRESAPAREQ